jgi:hypothetical protein
MPAPLRWRRRPEVATQVAVPPTPTDAGKVPAWTPPAAAQAIVAEVAHGSAERFGDALRAVVLTGSLARDEGTFVGRGHERSLLGDAEFLLVFRERTALPRPDVVAKLVRAVEDGLGKAGIRGTIGLSPCHARYLRELRAQIFAYELRACGRVVWGDPDVLAHVPPLAAADIDRVDAWRLLCNRLVEQLESVARSDGAEGSLDPALRYHTAKLWLDMATSLLVFTGGYEPTYRGRANSLSALAARPAALSDAPFDLPRFASRVRACTRFKLGVGTAADLDETGSWREAVVQARELWRWELLRLTGAPADASDRALRERWMRRQRLASRARGWAYAARRHGWHRSWRHWPRWARLFRRGSPRDWIYAAATELLFALATPAGGMTGQRPLALGDVARSLPVYDAAAGGGWRETAAQIYDGYRTLVVETRA